jgi:hypothetical protein
MGFDQESRGDPFHGDYPGRPEHEPWDEHEERVQRAVADLTQSRSLPVQTGFDILVAHGEPGYGQALKIRPGA